MACHPLYASAPRRRRLFDPVRKLLADCRAAGIEPTFLPALDLAKVFIVATLLIVAFG